MKRLLITGANGFVGRSVCRESLCNGWRVRGAIRRPEASKLLPIGVEPLLTGPLEHFGNWATVLADVDTIIHLAARTHVMQDTAVDPLAAYRETNVEGMRRLLAALPNTNVKRVIFLSSIKAVGEGADHAYTESEPCRPEDPYGISKHEAEETLLAAAESASWQPVILRSPLVYGPGVAGNFRRLGDAVTRGLPLPLGKVRNQRDMIFVGNLVSAILTCLKHPRAAGKIFHVADGQPISTCDLVRQMGHAIGRRTWMLPVPVWVMHALGTVCGKRSEVARLVGSLTVTVDSIRSQLDWQPPFTLEEGLRITMQSEHDANTV